MTTRQLFEAIGLVADDLVLEAEQRAPARAPAPVWLRRALPVAACLCLAVGAVALWQGGRAGNAPLATGAAEDARTADTAPAAGGAAPYDAGTPEAAYDAGEQNGAAYDAGGQEGAANAPFAGAQGEDALMDAVPDAAATAALDAVLPALQAGGGDGAPNVLTAYSPDELYFADLLADGAPATLPVWRSGMADHTVHRDGMRAALRQALAALGVDTALADAAVLEQPTGDAALQSGWQAQVAADAAKGQGSLDVEAAYWGGVAFLTLENAPGLDAAGVDYLQVDNTLTVTVGFAGQGGAAPIADRADAAQRAAAVQGAAGALLRALGADTAALEGGGRDIEGAPAGQFTVFYAAGQGDALPAAVEGLANLSYRPVRVLAAQDGTPGTLYWDAAGPGTLLGEYGVLSEGEALALLAAGAYYGGDGRVAGPIPASAVLHSRLTYTASGAALHAPVWEFLVEAGPAENPDAAALGLKDYALCYVPAIDAATLQTLLDG